MHFKSLKTLQKKKISLYYLNWHNPIPIWRTLFPIPSGLIPVPVTQIPFSQAKMGQSQFPFYPFRTLNKRKVQFVDNMSKNYFEVCRSPFAMVLVWESLSHFSLFWWERSTFLGLHISFSAINMYIQVQVEDDFERGIPFYSLGLAQTLQIFFLLSNERAWIITFKNFWRLRDSFGPV